MDPADHGEGERGRGETEDKVDDAEMTSIVESAADSRAGGGSGEGTTGGGRSGGTTTTRSSIGIGLGYAAVTVSTRWGWHGRPTILTWSAAPSTAEHENVRTMLSLSPPLRWYF